jgi:hypothetical protein
MRDPLLGRLRRQQRAVTARAPLPLAVAHVPPRPAAGTHLDHRTRLTRISDRGSATLTGPHRNVPHAGQDDRLPELGGDRGLAIAGKGRVIHNFHRFIHSPSRPPDGVERAVFGTDIVDCG